MSRSTQSDRQVSARTLLILAATYTSAAGLHAVLAVCFWVLWQAVLAVALALAALGFLAAGLRSIRRGRCDRPRSMPPEPSSPQGTVPVPRHERSLPPQRRDDRAFQDRG
jgi:hypothetical protein